MVPYYQSKYTLRLSLYPNGKLKQRIASSNLHLLDLFSYTEYNMFIWTRQNFNLSYGLRHMIQFDEKLTHFND